MGTSSDNQDDLRKLLGIQPIQQKTTLNQDDLRKILGIGTIAPQKQQITPTQQAMPAISKTRQQLETPVSIGKGLNIAKLSDPEFQVLLQTKGIPTNVIRKIPNIPSDQKESFKTRLWNSITSGAEEFQKKQTTLGDVSHMPTGEDVRKLIDSEDWGKLSELANKGVHPTINDVGEGYLSAKMTEAMNKYPGTKGKAIVSMLNRFTTNPESSYGREAQYQDFSMTGRRFAAEHPGLAAIPIATDMLLSWTGLSPEQITNPKTYPYWVLGTVPLPAELGHFVIKPIGKLLGKFLKDRGEKLTTENLRTFFDTVDEGVIPVELKNQIKNMNPAEMIHLRNEIAKNKGQIKIAFPPETQSPLAETIERQPTQVTDEALRAKSLQAEDAIRKKALEDKALEQQRQGFIAKETEQPTPTMQEKAPSKPAQPLPEKRAVEIPKSEEAIPQGQASPAETLQGEVPKEPYEMTKEEYAQPTLESNFHQENGVWMRYTAAGKIVPVDIDELNMLKENSFAYHKLLVQDALKAGKKVPDNVLVDYPDLKPAEAQVTPETPTSVTPSPESPAGAGVSPIPEAPKVSETPIAETESPYIAPPNIYHEALAFVNDKTSFTKASLRRELGLEDVELDDTIKRLQAENIVGKPVKGSYKINPENVPPAMERAKAEYMPSEAEIQEIMTKQAITREQAVEFAKGRIGITYGKPDNLIENPDPVLDKGIEDYRTKRKITKSYEDKTIPLSQRLRNLYQDTIDNNSPLNRFAGIAKRSGRLPSGLNPYILGRRYLGVEGIARAKLEWGTTKLKDTGNLERTGDGLKQALKPVARHLDDMSVLMTAEKDIENSLSDIKGTMPMDSQIAINNLKGKYGTQYAKLEKAADDVRKWAIRAQLDPLVEVGYITEETKNKILSKNQFYSPMKRILDELEKGGSIPARRDVFQPKGKPIQMREGSEEAMTDPLEQLITDTYRITNFVERARVAKATANLRNYSQELADLIVPTHVIDRSKVGKNIMEVFQDGKHKYYQVPEEIYKSMKNFDAVSNDFLGNLLQTPARILRAGAIDSPDFFFRNPFRDFIDAFIQARWGISGTNFIKAFGAIARKSDWYYEWMASGADQSMFVSLDRATARTSLKKLTGTRTFGEIVTGIDKDGQMSIPKKIAQSVPNVVGSPLHALQKISMFSEEPTRMAVFKTAKEHGATDMEAMLEARDATIDFSVRGGGATVQWVNQLIPFWRANVRGFDKFVRTMRYGTPRQKALTQLKAISTITLPSVAFYVINKKFNREQYDELPQWQKDNFWIIPNPEGPPTRLPKPYFLGTVYGTSIEHIMDGIWEKDPKKILDMWSTIGKGALPGYMPQILGPSIEMAVNKDLFTGRPIVPGNLKDLPKEMQYSPYTTETAKSIGTFIHHSPLMIDHAIQGYFASLGRYTANLADQAIKLQRSIAGIEMPKKPKMSPADYPAIRGFVAREPIGSMSQSVTDLYKEADKAKKAVNGIKQMESQYGKGSLQARDFALKNPAYKFGRAINDLTLQFADIRKSKIKVLDDPKMNSEEKTQLLRKLDIIMTRSARIALQVIRSGTMGDNSEVPIYDDNPDLTDKQLVQPEMPQQEQQFDINQYPGTDQIAP